MDEPIGEDDLTLMDTLMDPSNIEVDFEVREEYRALYESIKTLTDRQRNVLLDFYIKKESISDIAKNYGVKYRTVVNTKTMALEKMKKYLLNGKNL